MRDQKIDVLRFIGLALIILAHSGASGILFQLRNFDVPMMVLISGLSFQLAFKSEQYSSYLIKRIKRLVLPVWIFLTFYFLIKHTIDPSSFKLNAEVIKESYLFLGGIGYVWIIRVFLLVSLIAPLIYFWSQHQSSNLHFLIFVILIYIFYEMLYAYIPIDQLGDKNSFLNSIVFYIMPYTAFFCIGIRLPRLTKADVFCLIGIMLAVFIALVYFYFRLNGYFTPTQLYKYPPRAYYLSYALIPSLLAWLYVEKIIQLFKKLNLLFFADFAGKNSIWMYLWHIPMVQAISLPVYFKYPLILVSSFLITYLQVKFLRIFVFSKLKNDRLKSNLNHIFTG